MAQNLQDPGTTSANSQKLNLTVAVFGAIFCLTPLFTLAITDRFIADDAITFQQMIQETMLDGSSHMASFFVILIPAADLFLDFPFQSSYSQRKVKPSTNPDKTSVIYRLNDIERLLFIIGVAIQSCVWFFPRATDIATLGLVYDTTTNASVLLVLSPIATYLQRTTTSFSSFRTTFLTILTTFGLILFTTGNFFQCDCIGRQTVTYGAWVMVGLAGLLFSSLIGHCAFKYAYSNLHTSSDREASMAHIISFFGRSEARKEEKPSNEKAQEFYSTYVPALHMIASLTLMVAYFCISFLGGYNLATVYEFRTSIVIASEIVVLVIELRIRKNEVARTLVRSAFPLNQLNMLSSKLIPTLLHEH